MYYYIIHLIMSNQLQHRRSKVLSGGKHGTKPPIIFTTRMLMTRFPGSLGVGEGGLEAVSVRWYRGPGFEADGSQLGPAAVRVRARCQLRPWLLPPPSLSRRPQPRRYIRCI